MKHLPSIILASQSPRRKQLLEWAEISFTIQVIPTEETFPAGMDPIHVPIHIAQQKAAEVHKLYNKPHPIVLAADTIVLVDEQILGKPKDKEEAIQMLQLLSGRKHKVITGVVLMQGEKNIQFSDITEVHFHKLTKDQISFYVERYQPFDKAGAYAIQEWIGVIGIQKVVGDFYNVMGLPVSRVVQVLERW